MVKHLQQTDSCISTRKRVSFNTDCKSEDYSSADEEGIIPIGGVPDVLHCDSDGIERLLKVMQSLNVARMDSVERFAEISKRMNTERNEIFAGPKRTVSEVNLRRHHQNEKCLETNARIVKNTNIRQKDVSPVDIAAKEINLRAPRIDGCKQLGLAPVASPSQSAVDGVNCLGEIARKAAVMRVHSVDDDAQSSSESTTTDDTGSGNSSRRGSGDSLHEPYRGYSRHRRHGRKDSLGTVDFTRLIPTLVSDNEDFRQKEYQRQLSVQAIELQQSTW